MDRARRNVLLLALCQAAFISTAALTSTIGTLAGHALAAYKTLATLPATALTVGTALGTIPASLVMRRVGRRLGFMVGSGFTATLIQRIGERATIAIGIAANAASLAAGLAGTTVGHFWLALLLVGVGWNLMSSEAPPW